MFHKDIIHNQDISSSDYLKDANKVTKTENIFTPRIVLSDDEFRTRFLLKNKANSLNYIDTNSLINFNSNSKVILSTPLSPKFLDMTFGKLNKVNLVENNESNKNDLPYMAPSPPSTDNDGSIDSLSSNSNSTTSLDSDIHSNVFKNYSTSIPIKQNNSSNLQYHSSRSFNNNSMIQNQRIEQTKEVDSNELEQLLFNFSLIDNGKYSMNKLSHCTFENTDVIKGKGTSIYFQSEQPSITKYIEKEKEFKSILSLLPIEVLSMIVRYLPSSDIVDNFEFLNKQFNNILNDEIFWKNMVLERFGDINKKNRILKKTNHFKYLLGQQKDNKSLDLSSTTNKEKTHPININQSNLKFKDNIDSNNSKNDIIEFSQSNKESMYLRNFLNDKNWKKQYKSFYKTQQNWRTSNYSLRKVETHPCYITNNSLVSCLGEVFDLSKESNTSQLENVGTITCAVEVDNCLATGGADGFVRIYSRNIAVNVGPEIICMQYMHGVLYVGCEEGVIVLIDTFSGQILQTIDIVPQEPSDINLRNDILNEDDEEIGERFPSSRDYPVLSMSIDNNDLIIGTYEEIQIWKLKLTRRFGVHTNSRTFSPSNYNNNNNSDFEQNIFSFDEEVNHHPNPFNKNFSAPNIGSLPDRLYSSNTNKGKRVDNLSCYYYKIVERFDERTDEDNSSNDISEDKSTVTTIFTGSSVSCIQISPTRIVAGCEDGNLRIYKRSRYPVLLKNLVGHKRQVVCLQFDKNKIVSGGSDSEIKVWDPISGSCIYTLNHHTEPVWHLRFDDSKLVTSSFDRSLLILDFEGGHSRSASRERSASCKSNSSQSSSESLDNLN